MQIEFPTLNVPELCSTIERELNRFAITLETSGGEHKAFSNGLSYGIITPGLGSEVFPFVGARVTPHDTPCLRGDLGKPNLILGIFEAWSCVLQIGEGFGLEALPQCPSQCLCAYVLMCLCAYMLTVLCAVCFCTIVLVCLAAYGTL